MKRRGSFFSGIGSEPIEGVICDIILEIGNIKFNTKIVFGAISSKALLGQYGFFDKFTVKFNLKKNEVEITP